MIRILLSGCNGRMGQAISRLCAETSDIAVVAGVDIVTSKNFDYPVYADLLEYTGTADVVVDFSAPDNIPALLAYCARQQLPIVVATTGHSQDQLAAIAAASAKIPVFHSANMSLGISLLADLVTRAAKILGDTSDIEIIERHHNQKVDAPSGTALMLLSAAKESLSYEPEAVYDRHDRRQKRGKQEIGLHAIRGGTIVGEHEILFAGHDEVISIRHAAASREVFASGALKAARFVIGRAPGLYNMQQLVAQL